MRFKGTNSADRIVGAQATLRKLAHSQGNMVSTHDFELCDLEDDPEVVASTIICESYPDGRLALITKCDPVAVRRQMPAICCAWLVFSKRRATMSEQCNRHEDFKAMWRDDWPLTGYLTVLPLDYMPLNTGFSFGDCTHFVDHLSSAGQFAGLNLILTGASLVELAATIS